MGKLQGMFLFNKRVGNVVGRKARGGGWDVAIYQGIVKNPNTEPQQMQRTKFRMVGKLISPLTSFLSITFNDSNAKQTGETAQNAFMRVNIKDAISGTWPNYSLDYSKLAVAKGILDNVYNPSMTFQDTEMELSWSDNSGIGNAKATDHVMVCIYNATKGVSKIDTDVAARNERTASLAVPSSWSGDTVHVYICCKRDNSNVCSGSIYLGQQVIS